MKNVMLLSLARCLPAVLISAMLTATCANAQQTRRTMSVEAAPENFRVENLIPWCLVPFDAKQRGPEERAAMLSELGFKHLAYDWREEHVATWDAELDALASRGISLTAFWCSSSLDPLHDAGTVRILKFLERRQVKTQLWIMLPAAELEKISNVEERLRVASQAIRMLAEHAASIGCQVGLYNHGGWIGRPDTLVRVMQQLQDLDNVGIVYNFHHAHDDLAKFPKALDELVPHLICLNLNGMTPEGPKIQTLGEGKLDQQVLEWIMRSGYSGPIGILDHRPELDARESLQSNLDGLRSLLETASR